MKSLVLTLGHNSSAIFIEDGQVICGYEEERLSEIKSDSAFPKKAIDLITKHYCNRFDNVFVGHWFNNGNLSECKYWDEQYILQFVKGPHCIKSLNVDFTHHDSHRVAAECFYKNYSQQLLDENDYCLVADGFGTFGESLSIYGYHNGKAYVKNRVFDYINSLGLLYQYTTLYLGMKMHNHEYKMLGYEAHIHEHFTQDEIFIMDGWADLQTDKILKSMNSVSLKQTDPIVNTDALDFVRSSIFDLLDTFCDKFDIKSVENDVIEKKRVGVSYYVQKIVETVILDIVASLGKVKTLLLSGGLFYNVKLNNKISKLVGNLCILPVAGDQGAGLGVYHHYVGDLQFPRSLCIGHRFLDADDFKDIDGIETFENADEMYHRIEECLADNGFVNVVKSSMEFGPRALGSTSTIAYPEVDVVKIINELNDRTFVMPMAPMMTQEQFNMLATSGFNVIGSNEFMVSTVDVHKDYIEGIEGAIHRYVDAATCRPQIVDSNPFYKTLCSNLGPLINTSFNYHGVPIVFDSKQIIHSHQCQQKNANGKYNVITLIYTGSN